VQNKNSSKQFKLLK